MKKRDKRSLIDVIKNAIFTGAGSDVSINERKFLSLLIDGSDSHEFFKKGNNANGGSWYEKKLCITRLLIHAVQYLVIAVLWIPTVIYNLFCGGKIKSIFYPKSSKIINTTTLAAIVLLGVIMFVKIILFFVSDYILVPNRLSTNEAGVVTLHQPCCESHSFFLLNSSTYWTNTGIPIEKGDRVHITASGGMYSDIGEMYDAAVENRHLTYSRRLFDTLSIRSHNDSIGIEYCIYNDTDAFFGSILYQINNEHQSPRRRGNAGNIRQLNFGDDEFLADTSGVLYLTFNDILLTPKNVYKIFADSDSNLNILKTDIINSKFFPQDNNRKYVDSLKLVDSLKYVGSLRENTIRNSIDKLCIKQSRFKPTVWFYDNVGEYLVNIRIEHNIWKSRIPLYKKPFLAFFREIEHWQNNGFRNSNMPYIVGFVLIYVFLDVFMGRIIRQLKKYIRRKKSQTV